MLKILYKVLENPVVYDITQKLLGGRRVHRILKENIAVQLKDIRYNNVLDVGCGTGLFSDCFRGRYTGIDISEAYINKARAVSKGFFFTGDATALQFEDESSDLVFTLGVLHHLDADKREKMLREMQRVCKTGGHILIMDGLVPSNRLNVLGYVLAKLDRGSYKIRDEEFKEMIYRVFNNAREAIYTSIKVFPHEYISVLLQR